MGFKDWIDKKLEERDERKRLEDIERQKQEEEFQKFLEILEKFEIPQMKEFCKNFLGAEPQDEILEDEKTGRRQVIKADRQSYVDFISSYYESGQLKLDQLKDYALKHKIVTPSYFGVESAEAGERGEFERIINSIRADFQPENIQNEEHLQSQLTIFLKAKFPDMKVEREVRTKSGDKLDVLVDNKYVLELKVPKSRTDLRNLSAQLEEYTEEYPYLCAVIADISQAQNGNVMVVEPKLAENIKDYVDKYKVKLGVPSIVFDVKIRG